MSPKSLLGQQTSRVEMLDHAAEVFAKQEFHRTRTRQLTSGDGRFSEGNYFNKFKTKDGVLREIFHLFWEQMYLRTEEKVRDTADPVERLRLMVAAAAEVFCEHEHVFRVTLVNCYPQTSGEANRSVNYHQKFQRFLLREIARARKEGRFRDAAASEVLILHSLVGTMERLLNQCYRDRNEQEGLQNRHPIRVEEIVRHMDCWFRAFFAHRSHGRGHAGQRRPREERTDELLSDAGNFQVTRGSGGRQLTVPSVELMAMLRRGCFVRAIDEKEDKVMAAPRTQTESE